MEVSSAVNAATSTASASATAGLADNFDTFLTLLTTQLQNQDPLQPMDANQFTEQLVQFTSVEQSIKANKNLEKLLAAMLSEQTAAAVAFIGHDVEANGANAPLQDASARWTYTLPEAASEVTLTVTDASDKPVFVTSGETAAGPHGFTWNGEDALGNPLPEGAYTLTVTARNADGGSIEANRTALGRVTGVTLVDGQSVLLLGDIAVPLNAIVRVGSTEES